MATSWDYNVEHDEGLVCITPPHTATESLSWVDAMELSTKIRIAADQAHSYVSEPQHVVDTRDVGVISDE